MGAWETAPSPSPAGAQAQASVRGPCNGLSLCACQARRVAARQGYAYRRADISTELQQQKERQDYAYSRADSSGHAYW